MSEWVVGEIVQNSDFNNEETSITEVFTQVYRSQDGTQFWSRVQSITAVIFPHNLTTWEERAFNNMDRLYMRAFLGWKPGDEAGHLVAATLGGTGDLFNMTPQHKSLNRNYPVKLHPLILNSWFTEENRIRKFLQETPNGRVRWTVRPEYDDILDGRPTSFQLSAVYYVDQEATNATVGVIRNALTKCGA